MMAPQDLATILNSYGAILASFYSFLSFQKLTVNNLLSKIGMARKGPNTFRERKIFLIKASLLFEEKIRKSRNCFPLRTDLTRFK